MAKTGRFLVRNRDGREVGLSSVAAFKALQERESGWSIPKDQPYGWTAPTIKSDADDAPRRATKAAEGTADGAKAE